MPTRSAVLTLAAALAALLACSCAPVQTPASTAGPIKAPTSLTAPASPTAAPVSTTASGPAAARSRRLALAAFHLRDERGAGPAEALKILDEPDRAEAGSTPGGTSPQAGATTVQADSNGLSRRADASELALRAVALSQLGRYPEAVDALNRLMLARRDLPPAALADAFVERGLALAAMDHQDRAAEDYAAALALVPRHIPALLARADQLFALGQTVEAEAGYSRVIEIAPENVLARINRGVTRDEQGRFAEAIEDFTKAVALDPLSPVALVNRGVSRSQAGDMAGMCADYFAACRLGACRRLGSAREMGYCRPGQ